MATRIENILIPDSDSTCQQWKNYFHSMEKEFGTKNAREAWLYTWAQDGNSFCTKDKGFNRWAEQNGVSVADGLDKALASASGIGQNLLNGVSTITGIAPKIGTVVVIGGTALLLYAAFRVVRNLNPSDILNATPAGRAGNILNKIKKAAR